MIETKVFTDEFYDGLDESEKEQALVLLEAFFKFRERNQRYKDLWKKGGTKDAVRHCEHKVARMLQDGMLTKDELMSNYQNCWDEPIDLVNYAIFYLRSVREGIIT